MKRTALAKKVVKTQLKGVTNINPRTYVNAVAFILAKLPSDFDWDFESDKAQSVLTLSRTKSQEPPEIIEQAWSILCDYCLSRETKLTPKVIKLKCRYCHKCAEFQRNKRGREVYACPSCGAEVGVHKGDKLPLGVLASRALREQRVYIHRLLDPIWQETSLSRDTLYHKLARKMGRNSNEMHIASITEDELPKVYQFCAELRDELLPI